MIYSRFAAVLPVVCVLLPAKVVGQSPDTFVISGTVVEQTIDRPLKNVLVTIGSTQSPEQSSYVTDSDGRFRFANLAAGKYTLSAETRDSIHQMFHESDGFSTAIVVGPGIDSEHIVFPLETQGASISGTVVDEEGEPVRQAQILLFRKGVFGGRSRIEQQGALQTDFAGAFQFRHLKSGVYFAGVQAHPWYAQNVAAQAQAVNGAQNPLAFDLDVVYPVTYYADTTDPAAASPITLTEWSTAQIQITLRAIPALHVELSGLEPKPNGLSAMVIQTGPGGCPIAVGAAPVWIKNHYELEGFAPGPYTLTLQTWDQGRPNPLGTKTLTLTANMVLDITALPKTSLSGRIVFAEPPNGQPVISFLGTATNTVVSAPIGQDGKFTLNGSPGLPAGRYEVGLSGAPGFYFKSESADEAKFTAGELEIPESASVQLSFVAARGATRIDGIALKDDEPFAGAMVLMIPQDTSRLDHLRRDQSDSDGTFTFNDVAPGQYTVVAIDDGRDLEYRELLVIKPYLDEGQGVTAPVAKQFVLKVNVQPRATGL